MQPGRRVPTPGELASRANECPEVRKNQESESELASRASLRGAQKRRICRGFRKDTSSSFLNDSHSIPVRPIQFLARIGTFIRAPIRGR